MKAKFKYDTNLKYRKIIDDIYGDEYEFVDKNNECVESGDIEYRYIYKRVKDDVFYVIKYQQTIVYKCTSDYSNVEFDEELNDNVIVAEKVVVIPSVKYVEARLQRINEMSVYFREDEDVCFEGTIKDIEGDEYKLVEEIFVETDRWHNLMYYVYERKLDGACYIVAYRSGATEYQESEYCNIEYDADHECALIEAHMAKPITKKTYVIAYGGK